MAELFDVEAIAPQLEQLRRLDEERDASWLLYRHTAAILARLADYRLAAAPAHRLVLLRVLPAALEALQDSGLPDGERIPLGKLLAELRALLSRESASLAAARAAGRKDREQAAAQQAELDMEEQLVDVMLRLTLKEPVSRKELVRAGTTYTRLLASAEGGDTAGE